MGYLALCWQAEELDTKTAKRIWKFTLVLVIKNEMKINRFRLVNESELPRQSSGVVEAFDEGFEQNVKLYFVSLAEALTEEQRKAVGSLKRPPAEAFEHSNRLFLAISDDESFKPAVARLEDVGLFHEFGDQEVPKVATSRRAWRPKWLLAVMVSILIIAALVFWRSHKANRTRTEQKVQIRDVKPNAQTLIEEQRTIPHNVPSLQGAHSDTARARLDSSTIRTDQRSNGAVGSHPKSKKSRRDEEESDSSDCFLGSFNSSCDKKK